MGKDMFNHQSREGRELGEIRNSAVPKAKDGEDFSMRPMVRTMNLFCARLMR